MAAWTKAVEKEVVGRGWILDDLLILYRDYIFSAYCLLFHLSISAVEMGPGIQKASL